MVAVAAAACLNAAGSGEIPGRRIRGAVIDAVTSQPIPDARVVVAPRTVGVGPDGLPHLRPIAGADDRAPVRAGPEGGFDIDLGAADAESLWRLDVRADGYWGWSLDMVRVVPGRETFIDVRLLARSASRDKVDLFNERAAARRTDSVLHNPDLRQTAPGDASSAPGVLDRTRASVDCPEYDVPEDVFVRDLAGTGFTGMMSLDELIAGTVTAEMNDGFPFEALKAQAVAARTFALDRLARRGYANGGQAYNPGVGLKSWTATVNTSGIVLLYGDALITAYYSARCNGDFTLNSEEGPTLARCWVGGLGAGVVPWARTRSCSGHKNCTETTEPCCELVVRGQTNHIYGHGIGMCQRGAQELAGRDGWSWRDMLENYYTNVAVANLPSITLNSTFQTTAATELYAAPCHTFVRTLPRGARGIMVGGPSRPECALAAPYDHATWWEVSLETGERGWAREDTLAAYQGDLTLPITLLADFFQGELALAWPGAAPPLVVESASAWPADSWNLMTNVPSIVNGFWFISTDVPESARYYRLALPAPTCDGP